MEPTYTDFMELKDKVNKIHANSESERIRTETGSSGGFSASISPITKFTIVAVLLMLGGISSFGVIIIAVLAFAIEGGYFTSDDPYEKFTAFVVLLPIIGLILLVSVIAIILIVKRKKKKHR